MSSYRLERIQEEIQHGVRSILLFEVKDPTLGEVTITRVVVTKDLGQARVYLDPALESMKDAEKKAKLQALTKAGGFIRKQLASRLNIKAIPEIHFFYDETKSELAKIDDLFSKL